MHLSTFIHRRGRIALLAGGLALGAAGASAFTHMGTPASAVSAPNAPVVGVRGFSGALPTVPPHETAFFFRGPTVSLSAGAGQHLTTFASFPMAVSAGTEQFQYSTCYALNGGPAKLVPGIGNWQSGVANTVLQSYATGGSVVLPSTGTYTVGACLRNWSTKALDRGDDVNGWGMITG